MEMKEDIYKGALVIILEMNNDVNKIMGLGLVKNSVATDRCTRYISGVIIIDILTSEYRIDRIDR